MMKSPLIFLLLLVLVFAASARDVDNLLSPSSHDLSDLLSPFPLPAGAPSCGQPSPEGWATCHNGAIPPGITHQGNDLPGNLPLWVCRAKYAATWLGRQQGVHPGKIRPPFLGCHVSYGGWEAEVVDYDVLAIPVGWEDDADGQLPAPGYILPAGYEGPQDGGQQLYVCKSHDNDAHGVQLGKIRPEFHGCYYPYGGHEIPVGTYSVATKNPGGARRK
jgi:hypothetical protein